MFAGIPADHIARHYAAALRAHGVPLSAAIDEVDDPFDVFRAAADVQPNSARYAEQMLRDLEVHAVATATLTPGVHDTLTALNLTGHTVTIVSNNSADAVRAFLAGHELLPLIRAIVGRTQPDPALLKPSTHLVDLAIAGLSVAPELCVLLGDSTTDITAAHAAGAAAIGYANKPGKYATLATANPDAIIHALSEVAQALSHQPNH